MIEFFEKILVQAGAPVFIACFFLWAFFRHLGEVRKDNNEAHRVKGENFNRLLTEKENTMNKMMETIQEQYEKSNELHTQNTKSLDSLTNAVSQLTEWIKRGT